MRSRSQSRTRETLLANYFFIFGEKSFSIAPSLRTVRELRGLAPVGATPQQELNRLTSLQGRRGRDPEMMMCPRALLVVGPLRWK